MFLLKMDLNGNINEFTSPHINGSTYQCAIDNEGGVYVGGEARGNFISFSGDTIYYPNDTINGSIIFKYCSGQTGISNPDNSYKLMIFPNPSTENLTIEIPNEISPHHIEITDAVGRKIFQSKNNLKSEIINLKSFSSGIYFLKVEFENGDVAVQKFVKE